jgi:hypothetical protein
MKSPDIHSLRASVITGVWSSSKGANKVLQNAWDLKTKNEKIIFLFSISQRSVGSFHQSDCVLLTLSVVIYAAVNTVEWRR